MNEQNVRPSWLDFSPALTGGGRRAQFIECARTLVRAARERTDADEGETDLDRLRRRFAANTSCPRTRAALLVLSDLIGQGWRCRVRSGCVQVAKPVIAANASEERDRVRSQLHVERDRQLATPAVREFVREMETRRLYNGRWVSVFSLMRDGADLAAQLRAASGPSALADVIRPYLQIADPERQCEHTGLGLYDIWRYFRHTWTTPYRSVPGRSLAFLVRDQAAPSHPVVGIGALVSAAVQITVRDEWIGWEPEMYVDDLVGGDVELTEDHLHWLQRLIAIGMRELYLDDLLDPALDLLQPAAIANPDTATVERLMSYARTARAEHKRLSDPRAMKERRPPGMSAEEYWRKKAETLLFRGKRAETLAVFLRARAALLAAGSPPSIDGLRVVLRGKEGRQAIQSLVRRAKSERVGVSMADIAVCGSVPPYSPLAAGKLVAMLAASPEMVEEYGKRYRAAESIIASSLAARPIVRPAHLVYLGTTSIYRVEPTQYTRVAIPSEVAGGLLGEAVRYHRIGHTKGYSTLQFSPQTVDALATMFAQGPDGYRVNCVFGEGINPRVRKVRQGLDELGLPSDELLAHGTARNVYGVALASNFRNYLLGLDEEPQYLLPIENAQQTTAAIGRWWAGRWMAPRLQKEGVLGEVAANTLTYPIKHGGRVLLPAEPESQMSLLGDVE